MKTNRKNELTPQKDLIGHNTALAMLGLTQRLVHSDWLKSKWEGDLKWHATGRRTCHKAYPSGLIEHLLESDELKAIKIK
jgi:hypothetical protein